MIGDKLVITDYHRRNGKMVADGCLDKIKATDGVFAITVAGESGSGKSETAFTTAEELEKAGYKVAILGQDDYFVLPPKSNSSKRREDISWVGLGEVKLDLMDEHIVTAKSGAASLVKPNVVFEEDRVDEETLSLEGIKVIIAEGTYATSLKKADYRAFIDKTYHDTLAHRKERAREETEGEFIENVLKIEHKIISSHKPLADIILPKE